MSIQQLVKLTTNGSEFTSEVLGVSLYNCQLDFDHKYPADLLENGFRLLGAPSEIGTSHFIWLFERK